MKTKHTPEACPKCKGERRLNELVFLCDCKPKPDGSWAKHTYLAHQLPLYNTAPELLEACKALLAELKSCLALIETCDLTDEQDHALELAEAAIGKAEGREGGMKYAVDTCLYFAKSTWPVGNNWRSPWTQTKAGAEAYAKWFCRTWGTVGVKAKAAVFYRDGSLVQEYSNDIQERIAA